MYLMVAMVWTFWISILLVISTVALFAALIVGYLVKVVLPKYPPGDFPVPGPLRRK